MFGLVTEFGKMGICTYMSLIRVFIPALNKTRDCHETIDYGIEGSLRGCNFSEDARRHARRNFARFYYFNDMRSPNVNCNSLPLNWRFLFPSRGTQEIAINFVLRAVNHNLVYY